MLNMIAEEIDDDVHCDVAAGCAVADNDYY